MAQQSIFTVFLLVMTSDGSTIHLYSCFTGDDKGMAQQSIFTDVLLVLTSDGSTIHLYSCFTCDD